MLDRIGLKIYFSFVIIKATCCILEIINTPFDEVVMPMMTLSLLNDRLCGVVMHSLWGCSEGSELRRSNKYFNCIKCVHKQCA